MRQMNADVLVVGAGGAGMPNKPSLRDLATVIAAPDERLR